jgi:hypothetical protein
VVDDHVLVVLCEGVEVRDHIDLPAIVDFANAIVISDIQRQRVFCGQTHGIAAGERQTMGDVGLVVAADDDVCVGCAREHLRLPAPVPLDGRGGRPTWARHEVAVASRRASHHDPRYRSHRNPGVARTPRR